VIYTLMTYLRYREKLKEKKGPGFEGATVDGLRMI
jgi:hypothetical protein